MKKPLFLILVFTFILSTVAFSQCDDVVITSQSQVSNFSCNEVMGGLTIEDDNDGIDDIISLAPLRDSGLKRILGSLSIRNCNRLKSLSGIDAIETIDSSLIISENDSLKAIDQDTFPFLLSKIGQELYIENNQNLTSINGLQGVDTILQGIIVSNNDTLNQISSFDALKTTANLVIRENDNFSGRIGFRSLDSITENILVFNNPKLNACCWIAELSELAPAGKTFLSNNGTGCSDLSNLESPAPDLTNCPDSEILLNLPGFCVGEITLQHPVLNDRCNLEDFSITVFSEDSTLTHRLDIEEESEVFLENLSIGVNSVIYLAKDADEKADTCLLTIEIMDVEFPVFQEELVNDTLAVSDTTCLVRYTVVFPQVEDNCTQLISSLLIINLESQDTIFSRNGLPGINYNVDLGPGEFEVLAIVSDSYELTARTSANILITTVDEPVLANCPEDLTVDVADACFAALTFDVPVIEGTCNDYTLLKEIENDEVGFFSFGPAVQGESVLDTFPIGLNMLNFRILDTSGDSTTCSISVQVNGGIAPIIELSSQNIDCDGLGAEISASFDTTGYSLEWSGPNNFQSNSLIDTIFAPGIYTLVIINASGCTFEESVEVLQGITEIEINAVKGQIDCDQGQRIIEISEDLENYSFMWTGPDSFVSVEDRPFVSQAGWYFITVLDPFACTGSDSIFIESDISYTYELLVEGDTARVSVSGGTGPFSFLWDTGETDSIVANLTNGPHSVRIIDGFGCIKNIEFQVDISSIFNVTQQLTEVLPNPFTDKLLIENASGLSVKLFDVNGHHLASETLGNASILKTVHLPSGIYYLQVSNGDIHKLVKL